MRQYREIPKFPSVLRDLSFVVPQDTNSKAINYALLKWNNKLLKNFRVFDYYKMSDGNSYTYSFEISDPDKTLTDVMVNELQEKLIRYLQKEVKAELRK